MSRYGDGVHREESKYQRQINPLEFFQFLEKGGDVIFEVLPFPSQTKPFGHTEITIGRSYRLSFVRCVNNLLYCVFTKLRRVKDKMRTYVTSKVESFTNKEGIVTIPSP